MLGNTARTPPTEACAGPGPGKLSWRLMVPWETSPGLDTPLPGQSHDLSMQRTHSNRRQDSCSLKWGRGSRNRRREPLRGTGTSQVHIYVKATTRHTLHVVIICSYTLERKEGNFQRAVGNRVGLELAPAAASRHHAPEPPGRRMASPAAGKKGSKNPRTPTASVSTLRRDRGPG